MGKEAIYRNDDGGEVLPGDDASWADWVAATATRNFVLGEPLLDWLNLYGEERGFERDSALSGYDERTDFTQFIFKQGRGFEAGVLDLIRARTAVRAVCTEGHKTRDVEMAERTFEAMQEGAQVIYQGVLRDPQHRVFGVPDFLVRSDVLSTLFPGTLTPDEAAISAPDLGGASWHYRIVDVKFRVLGLLVGGELENAGSAAAYKVQLFLYNRALARLQGFEAPESYVLGRGWKQRKERGSSCLDRLGPVPQAGTVAKQIPISSVASDAVEWLRLVRREGEDWSVLPRPSRSELYPNSGNDQDSPWHFTKKRIGEEIEDLTLLWQVAERGREMAHDQGVYSWRDPSCTPAIVGVTGDKRPHTLQRLMDINRSTNGPVVEPARIHAAEDEWREQPALEFYVDFETVSDLADDFSSLPEKGGQPLIFMIGCGHLEAGDWKFTCFVTESLTEHEEAVAIEGWLAHMREVKSRLAPDEEEPRVVHWSPAEVTNFETAYNSAMERHGHPPWPPPRWFDFLRLVIREEPVVVRGAMAFGLKAIAKAMHQHGLIQTLWDDGPTDGLGAMVGAWWSQEEASSAGVSLRDTDLMQTIIDYNEVDCRVMMEIVWHLRSNH